MDTCSHLQSSQGMDLFGHASVAAYLAAARAQQEADVRSGKRSAASLTFFSAEKIRKAKVTFPDVRTVTTVSTW